MINLSGKLPTNNLSSSYPSETRLSLAEFARLFSLGMLVVVLHSMWRGGLQLPGHHGLEWMALLMIGRRTSGTRWAATTSSIGAATTALLPFFGFDDPFIWLVYLLPGLIIDLLYFVPLKWQHQIVGLALLGGVAHASKPLLRLGINLLTGWPYGSILYGIVYPLTTHIVFGVIGAAAGAGMIYYWHSRMDTRR